MFDQARALNSAMRSSESYSAATAPEIVHQNQVDSQVDSTHSDSTLAAADPKCFFCGNPKYLRSRCPAKDAICNKCQTKRHFAKVCRGKASKPNEVSATLWLPTLATVVKAADISINPVVSQVAMATSSLSTKTEGSCSVTIKYQGQTYKEFHLSVMPGLCSDLILGLDFQSQHDSVTFKYGGTKPPLSVCSLTTLNIEPPSPFENLTVDCHPIATKSRRYSKDDLTLIGDEVERLILHLKLMVDSISSLGSLSV